MFKRLTQLGRLGVLALAPLLAATAHAEDVIRVSGIHRQWVLRLGEEVICIQDMSGAENGATS